MTITQIPSPNRSIGRSGWTPDMISDHVTGGAVAGSISWVTNPASQVSYHFIIARSGNITKHVSIQDTAWANGTTTRLISNPQTDADRRNNDRHFSTSRLRSVRNRATNANLYTISIGHEGDSIQGNHQLTQAQLDASIWLHGHIIQEVERIYGHTITPNRETIVGHVDITPRHRPNCPGRDFPFDHIIRELNRGNSITVIQPQKFIINGRELTLDSVNINGSIFAPVRATFEASGATVSGGVAGVVINTQTDEQCTFNHLASLMSGLTSDQLSRIDAIIKEGTQ